MQWIEITTEKEIDNLLTLSETKSVFLFKHSTTCGISHSVFHSVENGLKDEDVAIHLLDLLSFRNVSNYIATKLNVIHQSPQLIVLKNGEVIYHTSHHSISPNKVLELSLQN
jgi:bacillithiol system protein YtxJ